MFNHTILWALGISVVAVISLYFRFAHTFDFAGFQRFEDDANSLI